METLFITLIVISIIIIIIGIFKPDLVLKFMDKEKRSRKKVLLIFGSASLILLALFATSLSYTRNFSYATTSQLAAKQDKLIEGKNIKIVDNKISANTKVSGKASHEEINVRDFGAVGDYNPETKTGTDDTAAILAAVNSSTPGRVIFFPPGKYKITKPIMLTDTKHNNSKFYGTQASELHFIASNGFQADKHVEGFKISDLRLMGDNSLNTVGILLKQYPTEHTIENLWIDRFGLWGIKQYGGTMFYLRNLNFLGNGKNHNKDYGGSINITTLDDTFDGEVSTVGILEMIYCRAGGEYGLYMKRGVDHRIQTFIAEHHDHAMYIERAGQIAVNNLYTEANTSKGDVVEVLDSGVIFNNPLVEEEIKYSWKDSAHVSRQLTKIDNNDISTRFLTANQLRLRTDNVINEEKKEGALQYVNNQLQIFEGSEWINYQKVLSGPSSNRPKENLLVGMTYYDTTLGKPIYLHNVSSKTWHDAAGNRVK